MPFYHAQEATEAIKKVLGVYHLSDETPIWTALWRSFRNCKYIEDNEPIAFYKSEWKSSDWLRITYKWRNLNNENMYIWLHS